MSSSLHSPALSAQDDDGLCLPRRPPAFSAGYHTTRPITAGSVSSNADSLSNSCPYLSTSLPTDSMVGLFSMGTFVGRPETALPVLVGSLVDAAHLCHASPRSATASLRGGSVYRLDAPGSDQLSFHSRRSSNCSRRGPRHTSGFSPLSSRRASSSCEISYYQAGEGGSLGGGYAGPLPSRRQTDDWGSIAASTAISFYFDRGGQPSKNLEVVCSYEAHMPQPAGQKKQQFGPLALLFRWYSKSGSSFISGMPSAVDLKDAAALPPPELFHKDTGLGVPYHHINHNADPTMCLDELLTLLSDFDVCPQLASRHDVMVAYKIVSQLPTSTANRIVRSQVKAVDIRFPQFCDLLLRLALAIAAAGTIDLSSVRASTHKSPTKAGSMQEAVKALMEKLCIDADMATLKKRLLLHLPQEPDRVAKAKSLKYMHVANKPNIEAAATHFPHNAWNAMSPAQAPEPLHALLQVPQFARPTRVACWREFTDGSINLGDVELGKESVSRITLRSCCDNNVHLRIDVSALPFVKTSYSEHRLAPGLATNIDIVSCFMHTGEWRGEVKVFSRTNGAAQCMNLVPFFANAVAPLDSYGCHGLSVPRLVLEPAAAEVTGAAVGALLRSSNKGSLLTWTAKPASGTFTRFSYQRLQPQARVGESARPATKGLPHRGSGVSVDGATWTSV